MVCYEALYYGLPVISADCGGPREMMEPGSSGVLLPVGDVNAYACAMANWIAEPERCRSFSEAARAFVRGKFSAPQDDLSAIFARLIGTTA
jgi:glycosyltransferase involved in cell wall biosynthesis